MNTIITIRLLVYNIGALGYSQNLSKISSSLILSSYLLLAIRRLYTILYRRSTIDFRYIPSRYRQYTSSLSVLFRKILTISIQKVSRSIRVIIAIKTQKVLVVRVLVYISQSLGIYVSLYIYKRALNRVKYPNQLDLYIKTNRIRINQ